jgi:hypothetical protein
MFSSKVGIILNFFMESVLIMQPIRKWRGIVVCFSIGPGWVPQLKKNMNKIGFCLGWVSV